MKHTSGRWKCAVQWNGVGYPYYQISPVIPASATSKDYRAIVDEHVANANLISAAPELLEALEEIYKVADGPAFGIAKRAIEKVKSA